ncbi:serine hydrolase domain-containing protein [Streptomyces cyaneofuscatus]|uniref:serine hydrolase domain-containing protein n=1 Tax=Streptomyces cyaneofuscatus TaxID=66883 RepID=UPI0013DAD63C|nr:serine hydrolase domain-containing protein [Streptomyces cyaneofuscatus]NDZ62938.1 beta-lactamase family protein [Streptomyces cyaneofuscatus]
MSGRRPAPLVTGTVRPGWEGVRDAFARGQAEDPGGAQLAVRHGGRTVVDLWTPGTGRFGYGAAPDVADGADGADGAYGADGAGGADGADGADGAGVTGGEAFRADSVGVLMSVSKALVAVCAHLLIDRGVLDPDDPVARHWPEFAAAGKAETTVADLLAHRAGLPAYTDDPAGLPEALLLDPAARVRALAAMSPVWDPGKAFLYHALTYGDLVGEVVRRVSGESVGRFFAREVAGPLGLDLWIGLPEREEHRFVPQRAVRPDPTPGQAVERTGLAPGDRLATSLRASSAELGRATASFGTRRGRAAEFPAAGGIGDARSLARLYAALVGPVDGVRLLSAATVDRARTPCTDHLPQPGVLHRLDGPDRSRFGLGFELPRPGTPLLGEGSFGHAGAGGRLGMAHPESGLAVGYVCTAMAWEPSAGPDPRWMPWTEAVRKAAGLGGG